MPLEEIAALPIPQLSADKSHLHLWTTNAFILEALRLVEHWGFKFEDMFVWVKPQLGLGNYWRVSHESMLLGVKGGLPFPPNTEIRSWIKAPRTKHSRKPPEVRALIEQVSPPPRLELFARELHKGWTVWGNEVEPTLLP